MDEPSEDLDAGPIAHCAPPPPQPRAGIDRAVWYPPGGEHCGRCGSTGHITEDCLAACGTAEASHDCDDGCS